jgi:alginate O-acetyltransferase complex protein AlgI
MLFNSIEFVFFFVLVTALYFAMPHNYRWHVLLAASCYFYMAFVPVYILILGATIVVDYFAGIFIEGAEGRRRKLFLICSLVANIGVLAVFKYYNFINFNLSALLHGFDVTNPVPYLSILLPIGLSFHTFQAMSYTIEVYRGNQKAERHFGIYALYVMFYPQLVAGPIERPQNLIHQFREKRTFDYTRVTSGLKLMAVGFFMKVVVADRLSVVVDKIYGDPTAYNSLGLLIGTLFFSIQIFCDFAGYSNIAIGAAQVMGFKLMTNFRAPYAATSVSDFWTRWHISLSTWFKDYLYVPLGGNRVRTQRWYLNIFIVFVVSGLWHGANWTFLVWGAIHASYIVIGSITFKARNWLATKLFLNRIPFLSTFVTFGLVSFAWIFFRAATLADAVYISTNIFVGTPELIAKAISNQTIFQPYTSSLQELILCFVLILLVLGIQQLQTRVDLRQRFDGSHIVVRWSGYVLIILFILGLGVFRSATFIYFQF